MGVNRRKFLKYTGCGAMASNTMMSSILNLRALSAAALTDSSVHQADDYKALVCFSLKGGNDSFNMLVPTTTDEYNTYRQVRSNLALERADLLDLTGATDGRTFALHPALTNLRQLYSENKLAFMANIGTLVEPTTVDDFFTNAKRMPLGLLSHSDQRQQWQTAIPHERSAIGWGGRMAELLNDANPPYNTNQLIPMNISLDGINSFQTGSESVAYTISPSDGPVGIEGYDDYSFLQESIEDLLSQNYADVFKKTYVKTLKGSLDAYVGYNRAVNDIELGVSFPPINNNNGSIGGAFEQVAKAIAAHETLGFRRQTFFITLGGFDNHDELLDNHERNMSLMDRALGSFQRAMDELGLTDQVVTFVISDFARTMGSNGNGTDHAWGGNVFALGGAVKGGMIYGKYPETLSFNDNAVDLGGGILVPTTSADVYFAELAQWFGVSKSNLEDIFPNLINFYDYRTAGDSNPLGFLNIT